MIEIEEEIENKQKANCKTAKPYWYKILMIFGVLPILLWPLYFYMSVFIFDNPTNMKTAKLVFYSFNSLPLVFIALLIISSKIFNRNKILSIIFLLIPLLTFCSIWLFLTHGL